MSEVQLDDVVEKVAAKCYVGFEARDASLPILDGPCQRCATRGRTGKIERELRSKYLEKELGGIEAIIVFDL